MRKKNIGDVFGKLTVSGFFRELRGDGKGFKYMCFCSCSCGGAINVESGNLKKDRVNGCNDCSNNGVRHHCVANKSKAEGGKAYYTWAAMLRRCQNPSDGSYGDYGGRGIEVCDGWVSSYNKFIHDMGEPPTGGHSIDRIDNEKGYSADNCRWASKKEQANNKRNNKKITAFGETKNLCQWADSSGIKRETIARRIKNGWDAERAVTEKPNDNPDKYQTPAGKFKSLPAVAKAHNLAVSTCYGRIKSKSNVDWMEL